MRDRGSHGRQCHLETATVKSAETIPNDVITDADPLPHYDPYVHETEAVPDLIGISFTV